MRSINEIYSRREQRDRDAAERTEQEQANAWTILLDAYFGILLEANHANQPSNYIQVNTGRGGDVAWPLCDWSDSILCLLHNGQLAWVDGSYNKLLNRSAELIKYCHLEREATYIVGDVFDSICARGDIIPAKYSCYRRQDWDRPANAAARARTRLPGA